MPKLNRDSTFRYAVAVAAVALATAARLALDPWLGDRSPFVTYAAAVAFAAWYGGLGPSALSVVLSWLAATYFVLHPRGSLAVHGPESQAALALFLVVGAALAVMGGSMHAALSRAEAGEAETRRALAAERAHRERLRASLESVREAEEKLRVSMEEAEEASRAKNQFLAVLSHELRTPLNPILLAVTSMREKACEPEEVRATMEMIRENVNLQARLIDDLLDVMRIVRGKMPLHWEVADCHRLIDQAVAICRSDLLAGALRLELDLGATRRHVNADPARLQQVVWNLVKNAVKFTPGGGSITVRTRNQPGRGAPAGAIVIEVTDTGIGIEPDVLGRIFDPFQQGETTTNRKFGGLGLGLAICKGVVEAHGGTITAESGGRDRGATFRVVLEALPEQAVRGADGPPAGAPEADRGDDPALRILVVEDEPATLRLMERLLQRLGHAVTPADTIATAFDAFEAGRFDLIVSDIGLPDGTGLDLMRRVVALRGRVPAIALTGYGMEDDIVRSRQAGFTTHMTKPIDFDELQAMIRQVASTGAG